MLEDIAIKVEHLTKTYKIYNKPVDRLKESLHPLRKRYSQDFHALNDISFEVNKGETIGIIGKNGAGKSTLLKIITGVLTPTVGEVTVNGRIASLLELGAGFNPEMTGIENIYMSGMIIGYSKDDMEAKLDNIIDFADIGDFINQPVKMYSSGMFARLAFAVNAFIEPDILIVDEALSVGDVAFQAKCITRMRQMMRSGVTILFVTHDMSIVKNFCKKCIYLKKGSVILQGNAEEIADVYLRETRDEMNSLNIKSGTNVSIPTLTGIKRSNKLEFKVDSFFEERVKLFRQGNAKVKIRAIEILDMDEQHISEVAFNQQIILRIYFEFYDEIEVGIGYHIRDDKNVEIVGSSLKLESNKLLHGKKNERYVLDFITRVPLMEGNYNITLVVSCPIDQGGESAVFCDLIENAHYFKVNTRENGRVWNKVYLPAEYKLHFIEHKFDYKKCACCGNENIVFQPLPNFYEEQKVKYGCTKKMCAEMINKKEYTCPICYATDRERAYALWMQRELDQGESIKILDIAPSKPLGDFIKRNFPNSEYKTGDLFMEGVDYHLDIMNMKEIDSASIDFFICSHVLEHVKDDILAMKELKRILKNNGCGILVVPLDLNQKEIDEDPDLEDVGERWRRFGQDDHIRKYSKKGFLERIIQSGLNVKEYGIDYFGKEEFIKNGLIDTSTVYIVWKGEFYEKI